MTWVAQWLHFQEVSKFQVPSVGWVKMAHNENESLLFHSIFHRQILSTLSWLQAASSRLS